MPGTARGTVTVSTAVAASWNGPQRQVVVLAAFPHAAYLAVGDTTLALVTTDGIHHPNAAILPRPATRDPVAGLGRGQRGTLGAGRLRLAGLDVRAARWWDPRPSLRPCEADTLRRASERSAHHATIEVGTPAERLTGPLAVAVDGLRDGDQAAVHFGAEALLGCGPGLTPAGDDVLAGLFAGAVLLAPVVRTDAVGPAALGASARRLGTEVAVRARDRTTAVSAALLRHAVRGEVATPIGRLLQAWTGRGDVIAATDRLLAVGSTSGHDLSVGLHAAARLVTSAEPGSTGSGAPGGGSVPASGLS